MEIILYLITAVGSFLFGWMLQKEYHSEYVDRQLDRLQESVSKLKQDTPEKWQAERVKYVIEKRIKILQEAMKESDEAGAGEHACKLFGMLREIQRIYEEVNEIQP